MAAYCAWKGKGAKLTVEAIRVYYSRSPAFIFIYVVDFDQVFRALRREKRVGAFGVRGVVSERYERK